VLRAVVGSSAQLTSFAKTKDFLKDYEVFQHSTVLTAFAASIVGGVFQAVCMTPFDLVSTRLYNQGNSSLFPIYFTNICAVLATDANGNGILYRGIADCFAKTYKSEGFVGLYKGLGANYFRLAPHGAFSLVFWDILKDLQNKYLKQS
jgi:solute carrier family 25 protein 34/35